MNTISDCSPNTLFPACGISAESLKRGCACISLDPERLRSELEGEPFLAGSADEIARTRPNLFSSIAAFISRAQYDKIAGIVAAIEQVVAIPAYRDAAIARAPELAQLDFGPRGAFTGFDFHLAAEGPQLIEINTNSGGALLNAALVRAQHACCREMLDALFDTPTDISVLDETFLGMFMQEWRLQRGATDGCGTGIGRSTWSTTALPIFTSRIQRARPCARLTNRGRSCSRRIRTRMPCTRTR